MFQLRTSGIFPRIHTLLESSNELLSVIIVKKCKHGQNFNFITKLVKTQFFKIWKYAKIFIIILPIPSHFPLFSCHFPFFSSLSLSFSTKSLAHCIFRAWTRQLLVNLPLTIIIHKKISTVFFCAHHNSRKPFIVSPTRFQSNLSKVKKIDWIQQQQEE